MCKLMNIYSHHGVGDSSAYCRCQREINKFTSVTYCLINFRLLTTTTTNYNSQMSSAYNKHTYDFLQFITVNTSFVLYVPLPFQDPFYEHTKILFIYKLWPTSSPINKVTAGRYLRRTHARSDACKIDALDQWCLCMLLGIKWYQFVWNDDVRRLTKQPKLTAIIPLMPRGSC